jgi:hypothetical protein
MTCLSSKKWCVKFIVAAFVVSLLYMSAAKRGKKNLYIPDAKHGVVA